MRKILLALLFLLAPPLLVITTIPFASLPEHIGHILLFVLLGMCMAGYCLRIEIKKTTTTKKYFKFSPSFTTVVFSVALLFVSTHAMPCPYMFSAHTAQTVIDHPCCNPNTPCTPIVSFSPPTVQFTQLENTNPILYVFSLMQTFDSRAPPSA